MLWESPWVIRPEQFALSNSLWVIWEIGLLLYNLPEARCVFVLESIQDPELARFERLVPPAIFPQLNILSLAPHYQVIIKSDTVFLSLKIGIKNRKRKDQIHERSKFQKKNQDKNKNQDRIFKTSECKTDKKSICIVGARMHSNPCGSTFYNCS